MSEPWRREWSEAERRALFEKAEALAKNCHAEWHGRWPQLKSLDEVLNKLRSDAEAK